MPGWQSRAKGATLPGIGGEGSAGRFGAESVGEGDGASRFGKGDFFEGGAPPMARGRAGKPWAEEAAWTAFLGASGGSCRRTQGRKLASRRLFATNEMLTELDTEMVSAVLQKLDRKAVIKIKCLSISAVFLTPERIDPALESGMVSLEQVPPIIIYDGASKKMMRKEDPQTIAIVIVQERSFAILPTARITAF